MNNGWRTVVIDSHCDLSLENGNLKVEKDKEVLIPLCQIREIIITTLQASITTALILELSKRCISVVFCNSKKNPYSIVSGLEGEHRFAASLQKQLQWGEDTKDKIWTDIIRQKISNQMQLLEAYDIAVPGCMYGCLKVKPGDTDSKEALAARVYFKALFGNKFRRHSDDSVNSALNYGYALLMSSFNGELSIHGYNTCLGVHHHSTNNQFNLSCDLMEPFRPFVDLIVFQNKGRDFDSEYKKELVTTVFQGAFWHYSPVILQGSETPHCQCRDSSFSTIPL